MDLLHLHDLDQRLLCLVTRAKDNLAYEVVGNLPESGAHILCDELIVLTNPTAAKDEGLPRGAVQRGGAGGSQRGRAGDVVPFQGA